MQSAGRGDTAQLMADAAAYGVILEPHHLAPTHYELWSDVVGAVRLFSQCATQWRATSGGVVGLDYGVLLQVAPVLGLTVDEQMLQDVGVMEGHAIEKLNRRTR